MKENLFCNQFKSFQYFQIQLKKTQTEERENVNIFTCFHCSMETENGGLTEID